MSEEAASRLWAIRLTNYARAEIEAIRDTIAQTVSDAQADIWQQGLEKVVASLGQMPERHAVAEESPLFGETIRKVLYRRTRSSAAYRVLYLLRDTGLDAPTLYVLHIRHSAQAAMTADEAAAVERP